ncbi:hypothetical protein [Flavobacterium acetivorans]|uniref:hypothetical protein n=1 Tax=Flavobacterium acetivorans TaxID=2893883 RepID=UPI001E47B244|nr:hypothetical protein [Flavobacterium sp. F-29]UFH35063.1 hypothetical protein LNP19_13360 [Flavobacterium sp. F-29]
MKLRLKNILISMIFIFSVMSCNSQKDEKNVEKMKIKNSNKEINSINKGSDSSDKKNKITKKLDRIKLAKFKKENQYKYTENDSVFKLEDQGKIYREIKNKIGEKLATVNVYDKDKLVLIGEGSFMFNCPVGIHKDYDLEGNIIQEKNFDKDFPFTFINLKQKLLNDFNINIDNPKLDLRIDRSSTPSENKSKYEILLYNELRSQYKYIVIDGMNGHTIKDLNVHALD